MVTDKLQELATAKAKVAELERAIAAELRNELAALPNRYGFASTEAFLKAVRSAGSKWRGRQPVAAKGPVKRRKRASITDEIRAQVKKLAEEGKTGNEIARATGISLPSVQNIKKALGLVKTKR